MKVEETVVIDCPPDEVWRVIADPFAVARLIPGAQLDREIEQDTYEGTIKVQFGPREVPIRGILSVTEWDESASLIRLSGRGNDARKSSRVLFEMTMHVSEASTSGEATQLNLELGATFTGPLATIAKTGGQRIARGLVLSFAERLNQQVAGPVPEALPPAITPAESRRLGWWARWRAALSRLFGRRRTSSNPDPRSG